MARVKIAEFGIIQKMLALATVTFYATDEMGENTGVKVVLYQGATGSDARANPQTLDEEGKLTAECWVEAPIMAAITGITERTERMLRKIKQNPMEYGLPVTSSSFYSANVSGSTAAAEAFALAAQNWAIKMDGPVQGTDYSAKYYASMTGADRAQVSLDKASVTASKAATDANAIICSDQAASAQSWATAAQNAVTGINWTKARVASVANVNISSPGSSIDSIALSLLDRVLLKNQTIPAQNGIYVWNGASSAMTRASDMDTWAEVVSKVVVIEEGSAPNADIPFISTANTGGTIGTTDITFIVFSSSVQDGGVSTAAKIVDGIITYAKMATAAIATASEILSGTASKIVSAAGFKSAFPNAVIQSVYSETAATTSLSTAIPADGTIPQNTEGTQVFSVSITPKLTTSRIRVTFDGLLQQNTGTAWTTLALFKNAGANAIYAKPIRSEENNVARGAHFVYEFVPGSTAAMTLALRIGPDAATTNINGTAVTLGGVIRTTFLVEEIMA